MMGSKTEGEKLRRKKTFTKEGRSKYSMQLTIKLKPEENKTCNIIISSTYGFASPLPNK